MKELQEIQRENEKYFKSFIDNKRIKEYFRNEDSEFITLVQSQNIELEKAISLVSFMYACQHANIEMLVGNLRRHFDSLQQTLDFINDSIDKDLVDFDGKSFYSVWTIPKKMEEELKMHQFPLPFVIVPKERKKNTDSSYYTWDKDSVFCGTSFTPEDVCLEVLYTQDIIPLKLNMNVANLTKNQWRSLVGGKKEDETLVEWKSKLEQFDKYDKEARAVISLYKDKIFYLSNKIDKRGRIYDQGYFIHSQGTDWNKGCLEFAEVEPVTERGIDYLKIAVANHYGLDKCSWDERINWTNEHDQELENIVFQNADEPAEMLGAIEALRNAQQGLPTGFPVGLDATTSCVQIMACLTNDEKAMKSCNVIGTGKREDAYQIVYDDMCEELGTKGSLKRIQIKEAIMTGVYGSLAKPKEIFGDKTPEYYQFSDSMNYLFPRVWKLREMMLNRWNPKAIEYNWILPDNFHVKIPVTCWETEVGIWEGKRKEFSREVQGSTPKGRSLGANLIHSVDAYILRELIRRCSYDPFRIQKIRDMKPSQYHEDENTRMILILLDLWKKSGMLSTRILDYVRPYNLDILPDGLLYKLLSKLAPKSFKILSIHDCFRVHANYGDELRKQYVELLAELTESDILDFLCMQINSFKPAFRKVYGLGEKIRKTSEYALL